MAKVVQYKQGLVQNSNGDPINTQQDAWLEEANCGCGIDCCQNVIVMQDLNTDETSYLYVYDGSLVVKTKTDFDNNGPAPA